MSITVTHRPPEPETLAILHQTYTGMCGNTIRPRKSIELRYFQKVLKTETRRFEMDESGLAHLAEGLAFYWLFLLSQRLGNTKALDIYTDDVSFIIKVVTKYQLVDTLTNKHNLARELAFIIGVRVFQTSYGKCHPERYHAGELMAQWFGHDVPVATLTKIDAYIDCMYGAGVWDLYATEMSWAGKVPRHLYDAGIDVNGPILSGSPNSNKRVVDLPDDL